MSGTKAGTHCHSRSLGSETSAPPSSAHSTHSEDMIFGENTTMGTGQREDVNEVLDDVIIKINRITDHLRDAGENEAANRFTQEMTSTLRDLYNIIAPWDIEQCLMKRPSTVESSSEISSRDPKSKTASRSIATPSPGKTWASIAAREPIADSHGIIKFRPSDSLHSKAVQDDTRPRDVSYGASDRRVVWIRPWTSTRPLSEITGKMQTVGAIYSMAYAPEAAAVCIIFQHGSCAHEFMQRCANNEGRNRVSLFGSGHDIAPGLPYPMTKDLARMDTPYMERRRLTFARAGLFGKDGVTQQRFREDIEEVVGPSNIELLWFFNSGNATVVFSAVPLARLVRNTFLEYGRPGNSSYHDIMVGYSHDPCEREMHLVSQIPGHPGYIGGGNITASGMRSRFGTVGSNGSGGTNGSGGGSYFGAPQKRRNTNPTGSKTSTDEEGWQTVKKRR